MMQARLVFGRNAAIRLTLIKNFLDKKINAHAQMGLSAAGIEPPSISFKSVQVEPYALSCDASLNGMTLGVARDAPEDGSSPLGYKVDVTLGTDEVAFSPNLSYELSERVDLTLNMAASTKGTLTQALSLGYKLTNAKQISVAFAR